ncbi:MAG: hypothetical protein F4Y69_07035 [Chloroflexi bacterium]|nr:hypothetical protein [Chloroflexota bacterium]MYF23148.1 hypothetical protein [Chloroflexota bacterium]
MAEPNFSNRTLFQGDCLDFLRGMNSETVDLIATDPPFNKNKDFHATPDSLAAGARFEDRWSWDRDVHPDWVDSIQDDWPAAWFAIDAARMTAGDDMGAFLCWLGVRIMEMHRVLAEEGSLYLHIDHTAHAYVKVLMDAIFGRSNFRNEIVWCYAGGGVNQRTTSHGNMTQSCATRSRRDTPSIATMCASPTTPITQPQSLREVTRERLARPIDQIQEARSWRTGGATSPVHMETNGLATQLRSLSLCTSALFAPVPTRVTWCSIHSVAVPQPQLPPSDMGASGLGWISGTEPIRQCLIGLRKRG